MNFYSLLEGCSSSSIEGDSNSSGLLLDCISDPEGLLKEES